MIETKHRLDRCDLCETDMVRCKTCNNNCCNGGYGQVNGEQCPDCPDAYNVQDAFWADRNSVKFV